MSLQASNISFSYGPRFGIDSVSLTAGAGSWLGLIGANGSGKTTVMRMLAGLLKPSSGTVLLDGEPMESYTANRRARHLAMVPQSYRPAFDFTVEQTVLLGRMPYRSAYGGFESETDIAAADDAIRLLELDRLRFEPVTRLSGGELQRVTIARALAQGASTLLLDEPTSHLDIAHQQNVLQTLRRQVDQRGLTLVASIHDLNLAAMFCDSIAVLSNGRLVASGPPETVLSPETLHEAFGIELVVEPEVYGRAPSIRYRYQRGIADAA